MILFTDATRTFFMKIFLFCAKAFKNVEVGENMRNDYNNRTRNTL